MKFWKGLQLLLGSLTFGFIGSKYSAPVEGVGFVCGFCLGLLVINFLDMGLKYFQLGVVKKLDEGFRIPEE